MSHMRSGGGGGLVLLVFVCACMPCARVCAWGKGTTENKGIRNTMKLCLLNNTTVDKSLVAGCFDPKVFVNCSPVRSVVRAGY